MRIALDIETNLAHSKIWCCVTKDLDTEEVKIWKEANELLEYIKGASLIVAHNGIGFDFRLLNKLWNCRIQLKTVQDTLTLSRLLNPSREGGHSLAAWGETLGYPKTEFNDFELETHSLDEMIEYCINDVEVLTKLYSHLVLTLQSEGFSKRSIDLEHNVQAIITKQEANGFKLDEVKSLQLLSVLKAKLDSIQIEMQKLFPPRITTGRTHKTSGKPLQNIVEPFNPGSRKQIAERLQEKGWKPKKHTEKGSVIVDEAVLETFHYPEAKTLAEYMMLQKRIAQIESWLDAIGPDGRVHGRVITCGAVTGRMTHMSPNMAQVPNSGSPYGMDCRELWTVEKGNKLVGIDASGLELRMLAHYMNDNAYTIEVVSGDIHTTNQKAAGLETRNQAKTFIYAFLYGAGCAKIGTVVGGSAKEGQRLIDSFLRNTPKLQELRQKVSRIYATKGKLPGLDGRQLLCRSEHSAVNTLLQGAGAIVMKQALVILDRKLKLSKIPYKFCVNVHDEWQLEVPETFAEQVGVLGVQSIEEAGQVLEMRCPLTGEFKAGDSWKATH
jgi:DNA polymerase I-like protein with 3'-5' exonuclease and polymerase domains